MDPLPGKGLFGWLGRQVGHVRKAVQTDPAAPAKAPQPKVVYREDRVEEQQHPNQPGVKFRRTVIDEVVVDTSVARQIAEQNASHPPDVPNAVDAPTASDAPRERGG